jgi:crotonobetainyl-CoA:carnitine CoA-transferase CaiB-like acyl-CoA transferase
VLANQALNFLVAGRAPGRLGNAHPNIVPYQAFATLDGHVILAVGNDDQFAKFCRIAGRSEWAGDWRFATNAARVANRGELCAMIAALMPSRTTREWLDDLDRAGIPSGPINTLDQVFADPQVVARGVRVDLPHASAGTVPSVAGPIRMREAHVGATTGPPVLGEHTAEVLREVLHLSASQIAGLSEAGAI